MFLVSSVGLLVWAQEDESGDTGQRAFIKVGVEGFTTCACTGGIDQSRVGQPDLVS